MMRRLSARLSAWFHLEVSWRWRRMRWKLRHPRTPYPRVVLDARRFGIPSLASTVALPAVITSSSDRSTDGPLCACGCGVTAASVPAVNDAFFPPHPYIDRSAGGARWGSGRTERPTTFLFGSVVPIGSTVPEHAPPCSGPSDPSCRFSGDAGGVE